MIDQFNQQFIERVLEGSPSMIYVFNLNSRAPDYITVNTKELACSSKEEIATLDSQFYLKNNP